MRLFLIFLSLIYVVCASYAQRFKAGLAASCEPQEKILAFDPTIERGLKDEVRSAQAGLSAENERVVQSASLSSRPIIASAETDRRCRG